MTLAACLKKAGDFLPAADRAAIEARAAELVETGISPDQAADEAVAERIAELQTELEQGLVAAKTGDVARSTARLSRVDPFELSTRQPYAKTSKNFTPEDAVGDLLISDFAAGLKQPGWLSAVTDLVTQYPNYRDAASATTPEKQLERLVKQMADNLVWLHNEAPSATRERSKLWYKGGRDIAERMSKKYNISAPQAAGILAAESPQKDWYMNVSLADRIADIMANQQDFKWSPDMEQTAARIFAQAKYQEDVAAVRGQALGDLKSDYLRAMWLRAYDEAHNPRSFMIVSPEGDYLGLAITQKGELAKPGWGGLDTIAKAVSIFGDGSAANISAQLGGMHKVRNFYNNILLPDSPNGHVTIDTHAVAAALVRPLSGNSLEVKHNFGGPSSAHAGLRGTYALYEEAYRRAAAELGLLPREVQSITWEAVRGLFAPSFKANAANVAKVDKIWNEYKKGRITYAAARQETLEAAGGITEPSWVGRNPGLYAGEESALDGGDVSGDELPGSQPGQPGRRGDRGSTRGSERGAADAKLSPERGGDGGGRNTGRGGPQGAGSPDGGGRIEALPGYTHQKIKGASGPDPRINAVAEQFARDNSIDLRRQSEYAKVDPGRATRIAAAFQDMAHAPRDPKVRAAYASMIEQVRSQYDALMDAGYTFTFFDSGSDPYEGNPWNAMRDLRANQKMAVYGTYDGYGTEGVTQGAVDDNPMLAETGLSWPDQDGKARAVTANDLFRAVHDVFGHGMEGAGFRDQGEENAWQAHVRLFTGDAIGAITSETRGQNSWLNFGPHGEKNRTAKLEDTTFADQKTGLMPAWTWTEGVAGDIKLSPARAEQALQDTGLDITSQSAWTTDGDILTRPVTVREGNKEVELTAWFSALPDSTHYVLQIEDEDGLDYKGKSGYVGDNVGDALLSTSRPMFYSQLEKAFESVPDRLATMAAPQWKLWLDANAAKLGVKKDEVEWSGVRDYLDTRGKDKVTRDELVQYMQTNGVRLGETVLGAPDYSEVSAWWGDEGGANEETDFGDLSSAEKSEAAARYADEVGQFSEGDQQTPKYSQYTVPGGSNYRELLITLPAAPTSQGVATAIATKRGFGPNDPLPAEVRAEIYAEVSRRNTKVDAQYRSGHFDQPNIVAHLRVDDRMDVDGKKTLFIHEKQSDWGQQGKRQGFKPTPSELKAIEPGSPAAIAAIGRGDFGNMVRTVDNGFGQPAQQTMAALPPSDDARLPAAPFVQDTKSWVALALKRAIIMAANEGHERVAFISGEQAAGLYDLSKQVSAIDYRKSGDDNYHIAVYNQVGEPVGAAIPKSLDAGGLEQYVGKEMAKKIVAQATSKEQSFTGLDLKVGGEGMRAFYDQIIPQVARDVLKKLGGSLSTVTISVDADGWHITPPGQTASGKWMLKSSDYNSRGLQFDTEAEARAAMRGKQATSEQVGFDITPAMREKVSAGLPLFSPARGERTPQNTPIRDVSSSTVRDALNKKTIRIVGATPRVHTPEQLAAMRNVGFQVEEPSIKERYQSLTQGLGKRLAQGIFDQFAPIRDLDQHAYLLTRLSKGASGAFESLLHGGKLKLSGGVYDFDESQKGGVLDKLLLPLQGEHHDLLRWVAANRAERLSAEGKEHLFSAEDIAALKTLTNGQTAFDFTLQHGPRAGQVTRERAAIYADSLITFNAFNENIMDMAEQSGLIDGDARKMWEQEFYVPFYRVADEVDGGVRGMGSKGSMVRQQAFKKLKGGKNALNADLLDNTLMNWAHLLDASAKNRAAKATLEAAERLGVAIESNETTIKQMGKDAKTAPVWFMDGGRQRHFIVDDPMLLTAISSLEYAGMRNPVMNAMGTMKHILTVGVTASPFFKIRNLIRDSVQVIGTAPIGANPLANVAQGWKLTDPKSDSYFRLLAGGGTIHFGTMLEGNEARRVQALVESGVDEANILTDQYKVKSFYRRYVEPMVTAYNETGNRGEAVNRAALYDQLTKGGMGHAEASLLARDMMDFSMQGSFTSIRFLTQIVPFLNARLQGLNKLGKAAHEDPKRMAAVLGAVTMVSLALLAAYGDDDDWKKRTEADRNNFWWFKVGGQAFRIPKPFEIGAVATLAERGFEFMFDKEMTGRRLRTQVLTLLADNLAMNPIPQAFKPVMDIYANKNGFTGAPIESMGMERLAPEYRFNDRTSMVARAASTGLNAVTNLVGIDSPSPVKIDYMLGGYFGWLGSFIVGSAEVIARPMTDQPVQARADLWKLATGNMISDLRDAPSRYVNQMYEQSKEIEQAHATWRMLLKSGKVGEAAEFKAEHQSELARHSVTESAKKAASSLNTRTREIERNTTMTADQKREALRLLQVQKDAAARRLLPR